MTGGVRTGNSVHVRKPGELFRKDRWFNVFWVIKIGK